MIVFALFLTMLLSFSMAPDVSPGPTTLNADIDRPLDCELSPPADTSPQLDVRCRGVLFESPVPDLEAKAERLAQRAARRGDLKGKTWQIDFAGWDQRAAAKVRAAIVINLARQGIKVGDRPTMPGRTTDCDQGQTMAILTVEPDATKGLKASYCAGGVRTWL